MVISHSYTKLMSWLVILIFTNLLFLQTGEAEAIENTVTGGVIKSSDGVEIYYQIRGAAPDTLIMLHGGPGLNFDYLAPDLSPLEEHFTLIYYDQRGGGRSTLVSEPEFLTMDSHLADLESVRQYFGLDEMALFGHSWGALLAAYYSLEHPQNLSVVVFSSPSPLRQDPYFDLLVPKITGWMDSTTIARVFQLRNERLDETINAVESCQAYWDLFIPGYFADPFDLETIERMQGSFCSGSEESLRNGMIIGPHTWASIENFDIRDQLSSVEVPVLIITGTDDIFPAEAMEEWEAAYPHARLVLLERAGHYPQIERPDEFFRIVKEFLVE